MRSRSLVLLMLSALLLVGCVEAPVNGAPATPTATACTEEAKLCPDGSAVGRVGPSCEFAPCPSAAPSATPVATPSSTAETVLIKDFAFTPATLTVKAGSSVTWINEDSAPHEIVFADEASPALPERDAFTKTFPAAGTYAYHCGLHPSMTGVVIVE